jgi:hypothetical protein
MPQGLNYGRPSATCKEIPALRILSANARLQQLLPVSPCSGVTWIAAHKPHSGRAAIFGVLYSPIPEDFWISSSMLGRRLENHFSGADGIEHVGEISQVSDRRVCGEDRKVSVAAEYHRTRVRGDIELGRRIGRKHGEDIPKR